MKIFAENLFFHELLHFLLALVIGFWLVRKFGELKLLLVVILISFLVDLDHLTEGFLIYGPNIDQLRYANTHGISLFEYSLLYRAIHQFNYWELCGRCLT